MKLKLYYLFLAVIAIGFTTGCSDDDDTPQGPPSNVPTAVVDAFKAKYPQVNASAVKWETKGSYYVADFRTAPNTPEIESWFATDGTWKMAETECGRDLFLIPTEINKGFNESEYAMWTIDDISYYEFPDTTKNFYLIEVETTGKPDTALYFDTTGKLYKTAPADNLQITPDTAI